LAGLFLGFNPALALASLPSLLTDWQKNLHSLNAMNQKIGKIGGFLEKILRKKIGMTPKIGKNRNLTPWG